MSKNIIDNSTDLKETLQLNLYLEINTENYYKLLFYSEFN
jgi:hypothetical protein